MSQPQMTCFICNSPITDNAWTYALFGNGPVHNSHRLSDAELLAMLDEPDEDGETADLLHFANGIDNADVYREGRVVDRLLPLEGIQDADHPLVRSRL